jgi:hypothetical protein
MGNYAIGGFPTLGMHVSSFFNGVYLGVGRAIDHEHHFLSGY